jgi:hypothetical protein
VVDSFCNRTDQSKRYDEVWGRRNYCHFELIINLKQRKSSELSLDYYYG